MIKRGADQQRQGIEVRPVDEVSGSVVHAAFHVYRDLGPGLLESVYESILSAVLREDGHRVERQLSLSFDYRGLHFENSGVVDLLVEGQVVVELKAVEKLAPVHYRQLLTYLRILNLRVGLLINFGAADFRECVHRVVNKYPTDRLSPLPKPFSL